MATSAGESANDSLEIDITEYWDSPSQQQQFGGGGAYSSEHEVVALSVEPGQFMLHWPPGEVWISSVLRVGRVASPSVRVQVLLWLVHTRVSSLW